MKYSLLIVALDCHYSHITRFIYNLKQENPEAVIDLITDKKESDIPDIIKKSAHRIIYHSLPKGNGFWGVVRKVSALRKQFKKLSRRNRYDLINIHFPHSFLAVIMCYLRKMSPNVIVTAWGSDVLRVNGIRLKVLLKGVFAKGES